MASGGSLPHVTEYMLNDVVLAKCSVNMLYEEPYIQLNKHEIFPEFLFVLEDPKESFIPRSNRYKIQ